MFWILFSGPRVAREGDGQGGSGSGEGGGSGSGSGQGSGSDAGLRQTISNLETQLQQEKDARIRAENQARDNAAEAAKFRKRNDDEMSTIKAALVKAGLIEADGNLDPAQLQAGLAERDQKIAKLERDIAVGKLRGRIKAAASSGVKIGDKDDSPVVKGHPDLVDAWLVANERVDALLAKDGEITDDDIHAEVQKALQSNEQLKASGQPAPRSGPTITTPQTKPSDEDVRPGLGRLREALQPQARTGS